MYKSMGDITRELYDFMRFYGQIIYSSPYYRGYMFKHKSGRLTQFFVHQS